MPGKVETRQKQNSNNNKDVKVDGIYGNQNICRLLMLLVGHEVILETKDGHYYEGIFTTCSPEFEVALSIVNEVNPDENNLLPRQDSMQKKMIFDRQNIVAVKSKEHIEFGSKNFAIDAEISNRNNGEINIARELEPWEPDHENDDHDLDRGAGEHGVGGGWSVDEMYRKNAEMGVTSTFQSDMSQYTTVHVDEQDESYAINRARAERIAQAIEQDPVSKRALDLENEDEERDLENSHGGGGYQMVGRGGRSHRDRGRGNTGDNRRGGGGRGRGGTGGQGGYHQRGGFMNQRGGGGGGGRYGGHERSPGAQHANVNANEGFNQWANARQQAHGGDRNRAGARRSNESPGSTTSGMPNQQRPPPGHFDTFPRRGGLQRPPVPAAGKFVDTKTDLKEWQKDFTKVYKPNPTYSPSQSSGGPPETSPTSPRLAWQQQHQEPPRSQRERKSDHGPSKADVNKSPIVAGSTPTRTSPTTILPRPSSASSAAAPPSGPGVSVSPPVACVRAPEVSEKTPEPAASKEEFDEMTSSEKKFHFNPDAPVFTPRSGPGDMTPTTPQQQVPNNGSAPPPQPPQIAAYPASQSPALVQTYPYGAYPTGLTSAQTQAGIYGSAPPSATPIQISQLPSQVPGQPPNYNIAFPSNNPPQMVLTSNAVRPRRPPNAPMQQLVGTPIVAPVAPTGQFTPTQVAPNQPYQLIQIGQYPNAGYPQQCMVKQPMVSAGHYPNQYIVPQPNYMQAGSEAAQQQIYGGLSAQPTQVGHVGPPPQMAGPYVTPQNGGPGSSSGATHSNNASQPPTPGPQPTPSPAYPQSSATPTSPQYAPHGQMYPNMQVPSQVVMVPNPNVYALYNNPQSQFTSVSYGAMGVSAQPHIMSTANAHMGTDSTAAMYASHTQLQQGQNPQFINPSLIRSSSMQMAASPFMAGGPPPMPPPHQGPPHTSG